MCSYGLAAWSELRLYAGNPETQMAWHRMSMAAAAADQGHLFSGLEYCFRQEPRFHADHHLKNNMCAFVDMHSSMADVLGASCITPLSPSLTTVCDCLRHRGRSVLYSKDFQSAVARAYDKCNSSRSWQNSLVVVQRG